MPTASSGAVSALIARPSAKQPSRDLLAIQQHDELPPDLRLACGGVTQANACLRQPPGRTTQPHRRAQSLLGAELSQQLRVARGRGG